MPDGPIPPLVPLHPDASLLESKLRQFARLTDQELVDSLRPERDGALKVRPDGTMLDGHHRIKVLRDRGFNVNALERLIVPKGPDGGAPEE